MKQFWHVENPRIICESTGCHHTAVWLTDSGMLYCQGHKYLGDAEVKLAQAVKETV